jgi:hypothetical protein
MLATILASSRPTLLITRLNATPLKSPIIHFLVINLFCRTRPTVPDVFTLTLVLCSEAPDSGAFIVFLLLHAGWFRVRQ